MKHPFYPDLRQRLSLKVFEKYIDVQSKLHDLTYLFWECTVRCNISCLHCGSDCRVADEVKDMPAEDFLKVTAEVRKHYNPNKVMIVITGGEPMLQLKELNSKKKSITWQKVPVAVAIFLNPKLYTFEKISYLYKCISNTRLPGKLFNQYFFGKTDEKIF